jgi:hypothetical protein
MRDYRNPLDNVKLDVENLKKLAPLCLVIGAAMGVLWSIEGVGLGLITSWVVSGGLYANVLLKSDSSDSGEYINIAVNGAVLAVTSELTSCIFISFMDGFSLFLFLSQFLRAIIIGAFSAVVWYVTHKKQNDFWQGISLGLVINFIYFMFCLFILSVQPIGDSGNGMFVYGFFLIALCLDALINIGVILVLFLIGRSRAALGMSTFVIGVGWVFGREWVFWLLRG